MIVVGSLCIHGGWPRRSRRWLTSPTLLQRHKRTSRWGAPNSFLLTSEQQYRLFRIHTMKNSYRPVWSPAQLPYSSEQPTEPSASGIESQTTNHKPKHSRTTKDKDQSQSSPAPVPNPSHSSTSPSTSDIESQSLNNTPNETTHSPYTLSLLHPFYIGGTHIILLALVEIIGITYQITGPQPSNRQLDALLEQALLAFHSSAIFFVIGVWIFFYKSRRYSSMAELMEEMRCEGGVAWGLVIVSWVNIGLYVVDARDYR